MSKFAPNWYVEQYNSTAFREFQASGFTLQNTTQTPVRVSGDKMHFFKFGAVKAKRNVQRGDTNKPMNGAREKVILDTEKMSAFDEVFEDDLDQMSVEENQVVAIQGAEALGRASDESIVEELRKATQSVGAYGTPMNLALLLQSSQMLQSQNVPFKPGDIFCGVDSVSWNRLLTFKEFSSSDYVGPALPFVAGNLAKTWNGIHVMQIPDDTLLAQDNATEATCLMWSKQSVGFGFTRKLTTTVDWDNRADCWTHNMRLRTGCKLLQPKGVVKILAQYDASTITL